MIPNFVHSTVFPCWKGIMIQSFQYSNAKVLFEHFMLPESVESFRILSVVTGQIIRPNLFEAKLKFCTKIPYTNDEFRKL